MYLEYIKLQFYGETSTSQLKAIVKHKILITS